MFKIPDEFRDIPEAVKLREAEAQFAAAIEQEKRITQQEEERVHLITQNLRQAQDNLQSAQAAFDMATGEPKSVGLTPAVNEEIERLFPTDEHCIVADIINGSCGRTLPFHRESAAQELDAIRLAVLRLSKGDCNKLRQWIELANIDCRDVINAAANEVFHSTLPPRGS